MRNRQIIAECDEIVALWDGVSPGTQMMINFAQEAHKPCIVANYMKKEDERRINEQNLPHNTKGVEVYAQRLPEKNEKNNISAKSEKKEEKRFIIIDKEQGEKYQKKVTLASSPVVLIKDFTKISQANQLKEDKKISLAKKKDISMASLSSSSSS